MEAEVIRKHFGTIEDPRFKPFVEHKLSDILIMVMCAVMCGLDEPESILEYANEKRAFLRETFGIEKIPSKSTLQRVLNIVNGEIVAECVCDIMSETLGTDGDIIALDGKAVCSCESDYAEQKVRIVSAFITKTGVVLGQRTIPEKTNEIPVVRELLSMFNIDGKIITADALHCQRDTVELIINCGGDYVIGLKGNQGIMHEEIKLYMEDCENDPAIQLEKYSTIEKNKDRIERRICTKSPTLDWFEDKDKWAGLKTAISVRRIVTTKEKVTDETSYYISSLDVSAERFNEIIREHWLIESMHYQLDVTFGEDNGRVMSANGNISLNAFRKLALAKHRIFDKFLEAKKRFSAKTSMLKALLNPLRLISILKFKFP